MLPPVLPCTTAIDTSRDDGSDKRRISGAVTQVGSLGRFPKDATR